MTFDESVVIDAEPAALFRLSQDYGRRLSGIDSSSRCAGRRRSAADVGVRAVCCPAAGGQWRPNTSPSTRRADRRQDDERPMVPR